jgi:hypothetical protein
MADRDLYSAIYSGTPGGTLIFDGEHAGKATSSLDHYGTKWLNSIGAGLLTNPGSVLKSSDCGS